MVGGETTTHGWSEITTSQLGHTPTDHVGRIRHQGSRRDCNEAIREARNDVTCSTGVCTISLFREVLTYLNVHRHLQSGRHRRGQQDRNFDAQP